MTDAWGAFGARAPTSEVAVYFERAGRGERAGRAWWHAGPVETLTLHRRSDPAGLARQSRRFLTRHPRGGVVGYVGFDAVGLFEPALASFPSGSPFPLGELAYVERLASAPTPRQRRRRGTRDGRTAPVADSLPARPYGAGVRRLIAAIRDGQAFQVVLAHRRRFRRPPDLLERAGRLRASERFSFFYYLKFGDREILGASPESVVEMDGTLGRVNPIAGTLPIGPRAGRLPLPRDPKELCEHRMLVDLARNDLGRVARPGTVRLVATERRERFARLEHLVSEVEARLRPTVGPWELLGATFPAGTVSGAPKIRATELLRQVERSWRGPYAGAVGCLRAGHRAEWALAIRTAFAAGPWLYTAAGAGIVHRSRPRQEFAETLAKLAQVESVVAGEVA